MCVDCCEIVPCVAFAGVMSLTVSGSSAFTAEDATRERALSSQLLALHSQPCAGSILGSRLGWAASCALKRAGGTGIFTARYHELSCPMGAPRPVTNSACGSHAGCHPPAHHLVLAAGNGRTVSARLTLTALETGLKSRDLVKEARSAAGCSSERPGREVEEIYHWLLTAPAEEVVVVTLLENVEGKR